MNYKAYIKNILLRISPFYRMGNNNRIKLEILNDTLNSIQAQLENINKKLPSPSIHIEINGFCPICGQNTIFISENTWLRDHFLCSKCKSLPRQRALMLVIEKYYPNWKNLNIYEPSSDKIYFMAKKFSTECNNYTTSEYSPLKEYGTSINGYRNENLEELTFPDETFDIVITQDVFEHIYNPEKALSEIARILRPGGSHLFTVPLINKFNETEIWAKQDINGDPIFLKTKEEYHGLYPVTMHWGYDIVEYIKKHSGLDTKIEYMFNLKHGIWAEYNEVLVSKK